MAMILISEDNDMFSYVKWQHVRHEYTTTVFIESNLRDVTKCNKGTRKWDEYTRFDNISHAIQHIIDSA